jgi:O-antigen biosynthesis protein WbqV
MAGLQTLANYKRNAVIVHDVVMTAVALVAAFLMRFEAGEIDVRLPFLPLLPVFLVIASGVYWYFGLYQSRWRFASLPDLSNIVKSVTALALGLLVLDYVLVTPTLYGAFFFGKVFIFLYWLLQVFCLGGPRLAYRYLRFVRARDKVARRASAPALIVGRGAEAEIALRAMESGQLGRFHAVGIVATRDADLGQTIRSVQVVGRVVGIETVVADLVERGIAVKRLIVAPSALAADSHPEQLLAASRRLGIPLLRFQTLEDGGTAGSDVALAPVEIEDLLLRPTVEIERSRIEGLLQGRRVLVTGGGGSIGSELCLRIAAFGASELAVVENSEPALHRITEDLTRIGSQTVVHGIIADVRDRKRIARVFQTFAPDLVFHAAALKHVPYLEQDWDEAIKTNVFGSVNVLEAARDVGARAAVMISTDKAIEPVSMLGATKRFAEMAAQALDAEHAVGDRDATRFVAVRFGNVLGSNGSVVPKFKQQIALGGPVTVTHPDMVRYFMTVREAAELVLTAASHADADMRTAARAIEDRPSVYVLKMGQPMRILDLAERMIRLAGFEPGSDIEIVFTGVRPGERMHEILFGKEEPTVETGVGGVMAAKPFFADRSRIQGWLARLAVALESEDRAAAEAVLAEAVPELNRDQTAASAPLPAASSVPAAANPA